MLSNTKNKNMTEKLANLTTPAILIVQNKKDKFPTWAENHCKITVPNFWIKVITLN